MAHFPTETINRILKDGKTTICLEDGSIYFLYDKHNITLEVHLSYLDTDNVEISFAVQDFIVNLTNEQTELITDELCKSYEVERKDQYDFENSGSNWCNGTLID